MITVFTETRHGHKPRPSRSRTKNALSKTCRAKQRGVPVERTCVCNQRLILVSRYLKRERKEYGEVRIVVNHRSVIPSLSALGREGLMNKGI